MTHNTSAKPIRQADSGGTTKGNDHVDTTFYLCGVLAGSFASDCFRGSLTLGFLFDPRHFLSGLIPWPDRCPDVWAGRIIGGARFAAP